MHPKTNGVPSVAIRSLFAAIATLACLPQTSRAQVQVDTELLFLVEVSKDIDATTFSSVMQSYGNALTNASVIAEIQKGHVGKIAASMVFWSDQNDQAIGLDWMEISDSASAQNFSNQLGFLTLPFNKPKKTSIASAINFAVPLFGTETDGAENGFSSITQIIDVAGFKIDDGSKDKNLRGDTLIPAATSSALASGIDLINGIAIGDTSGAVESYYNSYVIGGTHGGTPASVISATNLSALETSLVQAIAKNTNVGAMASVPEPSALLLLASSCLLIFHRRR